MTLARGRAARLAHGAAPLRSLKGGWNVNYTTTTGRSLLSAEQKKAAQYAGAIVAIAIAITVHTGSLIWFLSSLSTTVGYMDQRLEKLTLSVENTMDDRYRKADAERDWNKMQDIVNVISDRISAHARRIENLEGNKKP